MFGVGNLLGKSATVAFVGAARSSMIKECGKRSFGRTSSLQATQFLLKYEYIPEVLEKRGPFREEHIALANKFIAEGTCLSGGPTGDVGMEIPKGALFIFTDAEAAKSYAEGDPYVANGIVTDYSIEEWNVVVQKDA